jgi:hypothetical protein
MNDYAWARSLFANGVSEFLLLSPIRLGRIPGERRTYLQRVEDAFGAIVSRTEAGLPTPLTTIPTIHFARWALINPKHLRARVGEETPAFMNGKEEHTWLLTAVVFDGEASVYSRELAAMIGDQLDGIFGNCVGYPAQGAARDSEGLWTWFRQYQLPTAVFHAAYGHLSVVRIRMLEAFKARFDAFVAGVRTPQGAAIGDLNSAFDEFLRKNQQYASGFPTSGGTYDRDDPQ